MHKSIKLYCDDLIFKAVLDDALRDVAAALEIELTLGESANADVVICAEPYNTQAVADLRGQAPNILTYFIHLGRTAPDHGDKFDYKFLMPLRMGSLMDCVASILRGKVSGQIKRRLHIKNWEIQFPENVIKSTAQATAPDALEITDTMPDFARSIFG